MNAFIRPAVEALLDPLLAPELWPPGVRGSAGLHAQAVLRRGLEAQLREFERRVPRADLEVSDAIAQGSISVNETAALWNRLSEFLDTDEGHRRVVLYLPFEMLPSRASMDGRSELREAAERFTASYLRCWREMLDISDLRASFVDGDIPEFMTPDGRAAPPPRVVKAAHLIPALLDRGLLSPADLSDVARSAVDPCLRDSIADAQAYLGGDPSPAAAAPAHPVLPGSPARIAWLQRRDRAARMQRGEERPLLDAPFAERQAFIQAATRELTPILTGIREDPELSGMIFPVLLVFGSRLKGYGDSDADLDVGVFVRPGTPIERRSSLREFLTRHLETARIGGKAVEFWLADAEGGLRVRDLPDADSTLAGSDWAHLLFGAAWFGSEPAIQDLHHRLLPHYLRSGARAADGRDARDHWLEEMERDVLQYRLMHSGYARLFPPQGGLGATTTNRLDSASTFWDSGYRRLATRLFATRVFLPRLGDGPQLSS